MTVPPVPARIAIGTTSPETAHRVERETGNWP